MVSAKPNHSTFASTPTSGIGNVPSGSERVSTRTARNRSEQASDRRRGSKAQRSRPEAGESSGRALRPIAVRTAISFCRVAARASSRFAILAHAISSTNTTATSSTSSPVFRSGDDKRVEQAEEMNSPVAHFGILLADAGRDRIHLGLRLLRRDAGLQLAEDVMITWFRRSSLLGSMVSGV